MLTGKYQFFKDYLITHELQMHFGFGFLFIQRQPWADLEFLEMGKDWTQRPLTLRLLRLGKVVQYLH